MVKRTYAKLLISASLLLGVGQFVSTQAQAACTPVLEKVEQTLKWNCKAPEYVVESNPANPTQFVTRTGNTYTPPVDAGFTVEYRVRPKASPKRWSNTVSITYAAEKPKEEEPPPPPTNEAGRVLYRLNAKSAYDQYSSNTTFLREHIDRILAYGSFGTSHYGGLGIPLMCYLDGYTHWGAHTLNPTHRAEYVKEAEAFIKAGCSGIFSDDIEWTGSGQHEWATSDAEMLALIQAVKNAIGPTKVSELNTQWGDIWSRIKSGNPYVLESLLSTDHIDKEFGVNGASGISSPSSFADYLSYVDYLHAHGIHIDQADSEPGNVYELSVYLIASDGGDYIGSFFAGPEAWWSGYDTNLGGALGGREAVSGVYRRHFEGGTVYVDPPGGPSVTVDGHAFTARQGLVVKP